MVERKRKFVVRTDWKKQRMRVTFLAMLGDPSSLKK